jgi:hypothetical protein
MLYSTKLGHYLPSDNGQIEVLSLPMEPEVAPCGWRCPHRRPTVMVSIGSLVIW